MTSDDAISRSEITSKIEEWAGGFENGEYFSGHSVADAIRVCSGMADELPSVTPTRKVGKWIKRENINGLEQHYQCSNCGSHCLYEYVEIGFKNAKTKYCPSCGAEMEVEE